MRIAVITALPSPYQVEFLNAVSTLHELSVLYVSDLGPRRPWAEQPSSFRHESLEAGSRALSVAAAWVAVADLVVFNWYRDPRVRRLIASRASSGRAWVFWGEVPGFHLPRPLGKAYRRLALRRLHASVAPIWGIGSWAVTAYRAEFGDRRPYENIPYASDLTRFSDAARQTARDSRFVTLLYSGKLNERKGVDLILRAARHLLPVYPNLRLWFAGDGRLRGQVNALAVQFPGRVKALGFVPWTELPTLYATADILVAPSRHDGWNLAVPEGLAAGLPVISTDRTGAAIDLIRPGENGWRVPAGQYDAFARAVEHALKCRTIGEMRMAAARTAEAHSLGTHVHGFSAAAGRARATGAQASGTP